MSTLLRDGTRTVSCLLALLLLSLLVPVGAAAAVSDADVVADQLLVRFEPGTPGQAQAAARRGASAQHLRTIPGIDVEVWRVPAQAAPQALRALERNPNVTFVEQDRLIETADAEVVPNDPAYASQWGLRRVNAPAAWATTTGSADVTIAILDTGITVAADLVGQVRAGYNAFDGSSDTVDVHGHGTRSASVAGAATDNALGIASYCWDCQLVPVKVLNDSGSGTMSVLAAGIVWAADQGVDVISMSLSGTSGTSTVASAVRYATDRDVVLVAAAGNQGGTDLRYPAAYDAVIGVAGTDSSDRLYSWSNRGDWVDVSGPGSNHAISPTGSVVTYAGTSSATPAVAGVIGLGLATGADAATTITALFDTAAPLSTVRHGRVDAAALVAAVASTPIDDEPPAPDPDPEPEPPAPDPEPEPPAPEPDPEPEPPAPDPTDEPFALHADGTASSGGPSWTATVTFTATEAGGPVVGLVVAGRWSGPVSGTASCVTGSDGTCSVAVSGIANRNKTVGFTVTHLDGVAVTGPTVTITR